MEISNFLEQLQKQEKSLVFDSFHNADALKIGNMLAKELENEDRPVAIRIYIGEVIVFQYSMEGKEEYHYDWIRKKGM